MKPFQFRKEDSFEVHCFDTHTEEWFLWNSALTELHLEVSLLKLKTIYEALDEHIIVIRCTKEILNTCTKSDLIESSKRLITI